VALAAQASRTPRSVVAPRAMLLLALAAPRVQPRAAAPAARERSTNASEQQV
jgi:hypothetical protein